MVHGVCLATVLCVLIMNFCGVYCSAARSQDLYQLLGLQSDCSQDDVKKAYRKVTGYLVLMHSLNLRRLYDGAISLSNSIVLGL